MKKIISFLKEKLLNKGSKKPVLNSANEKDLLFKRATDYAFTNFSKTLKDLAYYDKHGKFEN